jgi:glycosyltransferase involved in cell wall biosynthesis
VEVLFLHLTEALAAASDVTVVTLWLPGTEREEVRNGVRILRVRTPRRGRRYWFMLLALPVVLRLARRADLLHTTTYNAALPAWLGAWWAGKPAVITVHEVFGDQWNALARLNRWLGFGYRFYEWCILRLGFRHYVCDSEFTRRRLSRFTGVAAEKTSVVYPAIDYSFWDRRKHTPRDLRGELGLAAGSFVYLFFGRPGISKGVEDLVEASALVKRQLPGSRLVLLLARYPPDGNLLIRRLVEDRSLHNHVVILEPVPREALPGYLLGADCVVVPSISEGFGYSAAEAAALGCTVVATTGHSVEEVLGPAVVPAPPRSPRGLAEAIVRVARERPVPGEPPRTYTIAEHVAAMRRLYERIGPGRLGRRAHGLSVRAPVLPSAGRPD